MTRTSRRYLGSRAIPFTHARRRSADQITVLRNPKVDFFLDGFKLSLSINWWIFEARVTDENLADALSLASETEFSAASVRAVFPDAYPDGTKGWSYTAEVYGKPGEVAVADRIRNEVICYLLANLGQVTEELYEEQGSSNLKLPICGLLVVKLLSLGRSVDAEALLGGVDETNVRRWLSRVILNFHAVQGDVDSFNSLMETFSTKAKAAQSMEDLRWLLCAAVTRENGFDAGKAEYERQGFSGVQPAHYALRDLLEIMPAGAYAELVQKELTGSPNIVFEHLLASARKEHHAGKPIDALLADCELFTNEVPPSWTSGTPWTERAICVWQLGSFLITIERLDDATRVANSISSGSKTRKQLLELIADVQLAQDNPHADVEQLKKQRDIDEIDQLLRDAQSTTSSKSRLNEAFRYRNKRRDLSFREKEKAIEIPRAAAGNPAASQALIGRALRSDDPERRRRAAGNPSASKELLEEAFAFHPLRHAVAGNPSATETQIEESLQDELASIRCAAAGNPSASNAQIEAAMTDHDASVRTSAAGNPSATKAQIETALADNISSVRSAAASNPSASSEQLEVSFSDSEVDVIKAAAGNASASEGQIQRAFGDSNRLVRAAAASNTSATEVQLDAALRDPEVIVRAEAAENIALSATQLDVALASEDLVIRLGAARNPALSEAQIDRAVADSDAAVRNAAAKTSDERTRS